MPTQLTVRIPRDLEEALAASANRSGLKRSDIVRAALRRFLQEEPGESSTRPIDRVRDLIGQARVVADRSDVRKALVERIRRHAARAA